MILAAPQIAVQLGAIHKSLFNFLSWSTLWVLLRDRGLFCPSQPSTAASVVRFLYHDLLELLL